MIDRYMSPEMKQLFQESTLKQRWHMVEVAIGLAKQAMGMMPAECNVGDDVVVDEALLQRAHEIEETTDHDLIAFVLAVTERLRGDALLYYHAGCTSYDIEDTAAATIMRDAVDLIIRELERLRQIVFRRACEHKNTVMIARTHNIHAEPITFGLYLLELVKVLDDHWKRLQMLKGIVAVGKISGAVGAYVLDPKIEELACRHLGLSPATVSTQVLSRDIYFDYASRLVGVANSLDRFATNIRLLAGTDIGEVAEFKKPGNKGSSAMPAKSKLRNPIKSENICGLSKCCRGYLIVAAECEQLWHQRSLENSSAERIWVPDLSALVHFMLYRFAEIMDKLEVYPEQMERNLQKTGGMVYAQRVMMKLTSKGMPRKEAYELVESMALAVEPGTFISSGGKNFRELIEMADAVTSQLSVAEIAECFDPQNSLQYIDTIFDRFKEGNLYTS